jgi:broad specificity phosphatase PhoE
MHTTIYLIRHGEVHNPKGILYGRLPGYGLSENGKKEIAQTAEFLKNKKIDAIYTSPLLRAHETGEIIREKLKLPIKELSKSLFEVKTSFQGKKFADLSPDQSEVYNPKTRGADDETIEEIAKRMHRFVERLGRLHPGKQFVCIGHGDPIMALRALVNNFPMTVDSIREGKGYKYIQHGEVLELQITRDGSITIKSVFQPKT